MWTAGRLGSVPGSRGSDRDGTRRVVPVPVLVGAVCGLAWAASLRAFMAEFAGPESTFDWFGTFEGVLLPGAVVGALLGWAAHLRGAVRPAVARGGAAGVRAGHAVGPRVGVRRRPGRRRASRYRSWAWRAATRWRAGGRAGPVGRRARSRSSPCRAGWSWRRSSGARSPSTPRGAPGSPCCSCPCWRCSPSAARCRTARPPSSSPPVDGWCSWASSAGWRGAPACGGSWPRPRAPTSPPR